MTSAARLGYTLHDIEAAAGHGTEHMAVWTLESELVHVSGAANLTEALLQLGLLRHRREDFLLSVVRNWFRSGSETYLLQFAFRSAGASKDLIVKACIPPIGPRMPQQVLESWIVRRQLLAGCGVATPTLYGWGNGALVEDFVPLTAREYLVERPDRIRHMLTSACRIVAALLHCGFCPVSSAFDDLRTDSNELFFVDFGSDLGEPNRLDSFNAEETLISDAIRFLSSVSASNRIEPGEIKAQIAVFREHFSRVTPPSIGSPA